METTRDGRTSPHWVILCDQECKLPDGFDASGVERGYFAPTNKDNNPGAQKKEYLTGVGERIL